MQFRRNLLAFAFAVTGSAMLCGAAAAQCILANPSFELGGQTAVFGGWNQFGYVGVVAESTHGSQAARLRGLDTGEWNVSGYWQRLDTQPGEQWAITGHVMHPVSAPLMGGSAALVNVEWHDAAGDLIDYDTFPVAVAATPSGAYSEFSLVSGPAPTESASTHLLLGVLQGPDDPTPDVYFDQVTFNSTTPPTIDDVQWNDFPGGRTVVFGGHIWRVKGPGYFGPGPNVFNDTEDCVWVDDQDRLHLTLENRSGTWTSTEVTTEESLGYGDYILTTVGRIDLVDPQSVLGIFLWEYGPCWDGSYTWWNAFNEIDIEYSRWGNPDNGIGQFVAQPYDYPGNIDRFDATFADGEVSSHAMRWLHDRIEYRVWRGGPADESPANLIHSWTYDGPHIPRPEQPRMHLNFWKQEGTPDSNQEVVFQDFTFVPDGAVGVADEGAGGALPATPAGRLLPAVPNPFNPQTTLRFELLHDGVVDLAVYDLTGRRVRTLSRGHRNAGDHRTTWDGSDDRGRSLASGVYLVHLRGVEFSESRRVTLVK